MKKVIVYSTTSCPFCVMAKDFLRSNKMAFVDCDVSASPVKAAEMFKKSGQNGVPVIDVDGQIIVGFDKEALEKALGLSGDD